MSPLSDTIVAPATPAGTSAIALVRVSGTDTKTVAADIFGELTLTLSPRLARHADYYNRNGVLVDDVVVTFYAGPRSYTGEDSLEISCHGNPLIVQKILEDLMGRGCRAAQPGEFTQRAFLNGRLDLSEAEAVMDLVHARSDRALEAAQRQLRGGLRRRMETLTGRLLDVLAIVEAHIDFPEDDLPGEDRQRLIAHIVDLQQDTSALLATNHYGNVLREGFKVVIVGPPNAGKSSLLNRLVGRPRALVSDRPGTTRDFIEERLHLGGHLLRLIDTAGLNESPEALEAEGIALSRQMAGDADVLLLIVDSSLPFPHLDAELEGWIKRCPTVLVRNKCDLTPSGTVSGPPEVFADIAISTLRGDGWQELLEALDRAINIPSLVLGAESVAISARHAASLTDAQLSFQQAHRKLLLPSCPSELLASDLRNALATFGEISGKVDNEQMLDRLFASFCIGK